MHTLLSLTLAAQLVAVNHQVTPLDTETRVTTTLVLTDEDPHAVTIRPPLRAEQLDTPPGVEAHLAEDGRVDALWVHGRMRHVLVIHLPHNGHALTLPVLGAGVPTRVELAREWTTVPLEGWEHHTAHATAPGMDGDARRALDRVLGDRVHSPRAWRLYLFARAPLELALRPPGFRRQQGWVGAAGAAGLSLVGLWWWQARLKRAAELQQAEAVLAREMPRFRSQG